jgi:hypothetical protein
MSLRWETNHLVRCQRRKQRYPEGLEQRRPKPVLLWPSIPSRLWSETPWLLLKRNRWWPISTLKFSSPKRPKALFRSQLPPVEEHPRLTLLRWRGITPSKHLRGITLCQHTGMHPNLTLKKQLCRLAVYQPEGCGPPLLEAPSWPQRIL